VSLRILSYNIRYGGVGKEAEIAAVVRAVAPDVVMLQEATHPSVVEHVARETGMSTCGVRMRHSTGFLSRIPVESHEWYHPRGAKHAFLEVVLAGRSCRLYGLHLTAWFSKWSERQREREIRALLEGIREHQHGFHLVLGDFNALAPGEALRSDRMPRWIRTMVWVSGRDIARTTIQTMLDANYADAWRTLHPSEEGYGFPTWDPHVRLDYVFVPQRYAARIAHCQVVTDAPHVKTASDHFPLLVEVSEVDR
jgi:endonuclease/exonuclease/phosphatase family metal-dependent hydrolase